MSCCECGFKTPKYSFTCPTCAGRTDCVVPSVFRACNRECQTKFWKVHKKSHPPKSGANAKTNTSQSTKKDTPNVPSGLGATASVQDLLGVMTNKQSWFQQMKSSGRAEEWLVDCYRMRLDDDYCWGGCYLHGLYDPEFQDTSRSAKSLNIVKDFLVFMKLAVANEVVPTNFDFRKCLREGAELLNYAFEKSDAQEKWGGENVFSLRPSLRRTAEYVYGSGCVAGDDSNNNGGLQDMIREAAERFLVDKTVCQDVGGQVIWKELMRSL